MGAEVRANGLKGVGAYIRSLDAAKVSQIEAGLPDETKRALYTDASAQTWYPIGVWKEPLDRIVALHSDPRDARKALRAVGRLTCEVTVNSFYRVFMRILTPGLFAKKCGQSLGKDFRGFPGGQPDTICDLSKEKEGLLTIDLRNAALHPYLGATGQGFIEFIFGYMGKKNVEIDEPDCPPEQWAPDVIRWRVRWG